MGQHFYAGIAIALMAAFAPLSAQEKQPPGQAKLPAVQLSEAEKQFEARVTRLDEYLSKNSPYGVAIDSAWKSDGAGQEREGKNVFRLVVGKNREQFRIEAGKGGDKRPGLTVVSDGKSATHLYAPKMLYTQRTTEDPFAELQRDALTVNALEGSGIDFLVRKNVRRYLLTQAVAVHNLGSDKLDGKEARHFKLTLANRRQVDVWFDEGGQPVVRQVETTLEIPVKGKEIYRLTIHTRLDWTFNPKLAGDEFVLKLPEGARKVHNLLDALLQGDAGELLGRPAPRLHLTTLDGKEAPADRKGKEIVVLYLWATWCARAAADLAGLNKLVADYEKKGVVLFAVNVGEKPDAVKSAVAKHGYEGTVVLDPKGESLEAYRLAAIPAVILIGGDGTVQAVHAGAGPGVRGQIRRDVEALVKGERLARPAEKK